MKKIISAAFCAILACVSLGAQNIEEEDAGSDIQVVGNEVLVDSTLVGKSILQVMPEGVSVHQSKAIGNALDRQIEAGAAKQYSGFRIRIFFDSAQDARNKSFAVLERFKEAHPDMEGYRSYDSPNFKVTVGNFRNRAEADAALETLKQEFPSAFVVREKFKYPAIGRYASTTGSSKETL